MNEIRSSPVGADPSIPEIPEDVAVLYTWANVQGAKYRDFSALRREYRAQQRIRMAEAKRESEPAEAREPEGAPDHAPEAAGTKQTAPGDASLTASNAVLAAEGAGEQFVRRRETAQRHVPAAKGSEQILPQEERTADEAQLHEVVPRHDERSKSMLRSYPAENEQRERFRTAASTQGEGAGRWFALNGLMHAGIGRHAETPADASCSRLPAPCLAVVAFSGGVGKTSLVATVGRVLASFGEKVLLAETPPFCMLPYYFGSRDLRPSMVRTFAPPSGSADAEISLVNYETDHLNGDDPGKEALLKELIGHASGAGRILLDLNGSDAWLARLMMRQHCDILVPLSPDMNAVLSVGKVDRFFAEDNEDSPKVPYYVLNQFDASQPLHLDVREVLREQLGERLLPVAIGRSPAVAEALAEGMTVIDYAPESPVAEDYRHVAAWVGARSAPAAADLCSIRWSER